MYCKDEKSLINPNVLGTYCVPGRPGCWESTGVLG